jgi:predicted  nucleic acid-binding Zn-ribbon protein
METARQDLVLMVRLQGLYDEITGALLERRTPPPEVKELEEANREKQQELERLEEVRAAHESELREVRKREEECRLELDHFQKQKGMVTNEREFTAVISEIDYATRELESAAARREELETALSSAREEIEDRRQSRPEEEAAHQAITEEWERRKDELKQRVHELAVEAKKLEEDLAPKHRGRFMRLLESKRGTALSAVVEDSCSLCHFSLRPHLQQRVRRCEEIITCEHCHRILYLEEVIADGAS